MSEQAVEPKPKGTLVVNRELQAMAKIDTILAELGPRPRARVVAWLSDVYSEANQEKDDEFGF